MISYSIVLPTRNESGNIGRLIASLQRLDIFSNAEVIVVDDDSTDGTVEVVKSLSRSDPRIRLIRRVGRHGLASAIKEGLLDASGDWAVVMDSDGQHDPESVEAALALLQGRELDLVIGSRFLPGATIDGLSDSRKAGSNWANAWARRSLPKPYRHLTDFMSGFFALRLAGCVDLIKRVDVHGFKFLYEFLAISSGRLRCMELPLRFRARDSGSSKLDVAIFWDFLVSLLHNLSLRLLPRRAISFGLVGLSGVGVQLVANYLLMAALGLKFDQALPVAVLVASSSNYLINNALTFRFKRLQGLDLLVGMIKFWFVSSLPVIANVGLASAYYRLVQPDVVWSQIAGIAIVFIWNYAASNRLVWNSP